jgi:hypothetical protein
LLNSSIRRIKIDEYKKTKMLSTRIPKKTPTPNTLRPVLPLIAEKLTTIEDDKTRFITIELAKLAVLAERSGPGGHGLVRVKLNVSTRFVRDSPPEN